jgi:hypothetical protein
MDLKISDTVVRDWRAAPDDPAPAQSPMSDQVWEVLEGLESPGRLASLMQGMKLIDSAMTTDGTIDAAEWDVVACAMRSVLLGGIAAADTDSIYDAFVVQAALLAAS